MPLTSDSKVLVIRLSSIGDIVVCSPIFRCLKKQIGCEVHFLVKRKFHHVQQSNPYIDKHYIYEDPRLQVKIKIEEYDLIIDLHKNLRTLGVKAWSKVKSISFNKLNIEKWMLTNLKIDKLTKLHLVDRYFEALAPLGIKNDGAGLDYFGEIDHIYDEELPADFVALVIGAAHYTKRIPAELCISIINRYDGKVVLLGGMAEKVIGEQIVRSTKCINKVGKLSLDQSASVISRCNVVITGDTGLMHIAAALNKPIVSIWGSTSPVLGMFPYFGDNKPTERRIDLKLPCKPCTKIGKKRCPKGHFNCMNNLSADDIISQTNEILLRN